jgi:hypothetical protein
MESIHAVVDRVVRQELNASRVNRWYSKMKSFRTSIAIRATQASLWSLLTDVARWPEWNPTIDRIEGSVASVALGAKVTAYTRLSPNRAFPLIMDELVEPHRMVWKGGIPLGLFQGKRTYTLTPFPDNQIEFCMEEVLSGLMAPLITKSIPDLQPSFDEFTACLKKKAEA